MEEKDEAIGALREEAAGSPLDVPLVRPHRRQPGVIVEDCFLVGDLDVLALASSSRMPEARQRGDGGVHTRVKFGLEPGQGERFSGGVAGDVEVPARRPFGQRRREPISAWSAAAVWGKRDDDGRGLDCSDRVLKSSAFFALEVVENHIGGANQFFECVGIERSAESELADIEPVEEGALPADEWRLGSYSVAPWRLDFDDLRPQVAEQATAVGTGNSCGEFEDNDIVECTTWHERDLS